MTPWDLGNYHEVTDPVLSVINRRFGGPEAGSRELALRRVFAEGAPLT